MRNFLILCLAINIATTVAHASDPPPPNVVLLFADDLGYGDLGCFGSKIIRTPNIDRIAAEGIKLTNFYVAQSVCSASRAALMTGRYPNRVGVLGALMPDAKNGIPDKEFTLGNLFQSRGYATSIVGKWHLGHLPQWLPTRHGFDEYFGLPYSNDMGPDNPNKRPHPPLPLFDGEKVIESNPDQSTLPERYGDCAVSFIERNHQKPFFLYLPFTFPHVPLFVGPKFANRSPHGKYADVVEELDSTVGRVLETLDRLKLANNTLVIFTSDNGPWLIYGEHGGVTGGLREGKGTSFEGGTRVPCVARWPGHIPPGTVSHEPAMTIDMLPTFASVIDAKIPKDTKIDGHARREFLTGKADTDKPPTPLFFYYGKQLQAVRLGKWKLHVPHMYIHLEEVGKDGMPGKSVNKRMEQSLFDLIADAQESTDVAAKHPEVVAEIMKHVERIRAELGDAPLSAEKAAKKKE